MPIKDVKTFIRAMRGVVSAMPEAEGWIVGPEEEDPDYASECRSLVASLGLQDKVKFLGFRRIGEVLPQLGLMVLTSISEAQPLVILEAWAAGAPVVSSDVGSCRELIEGADAEDRAWVAPGRWWRSPTRRPLRGRSSPCCAIRSAGRRPRRSACNGSNATTPRR